MSYQETANQQFNKLVENYYSINPREVSGTRNQSYYYYRRKLYQMIYSRFKFKNLPKNWDIDYIRDNLFQRGVMCVTHTELGVLCLRGSYNGLNVYEKPTEMMISNPVLGTLQRKIGVDCEPVYFEYFNQSYDTMENIVNRYALLLAQIDASINTTLINSRVAHVFTSSSKNALKSMKKAYDEVTGGSPSIFMLNNGEEYDVKTAPYFNNVKNTYIANDILLTKQTIVNEFCTEIGLNNANTDKRERLIVDEVNANNEYTYTMINMWIDTLNACFKRCTKLFPQIGNITVELAKTPLNEDLSVYSWNKED